MQRGKVSKSFLSTFNPKPEQLKKSVQFSIDPVDDFAEVFGIVHEVIFVNIDDEQAAFVIVLYPGFIAFVKAAQVVYGNGVFIVTATLVYLLHEVRDGAAEVDKQIGRAHKG